MRTYKQLTQIQRFQIYALKRMDHNQTEIANIIGVHKSTISRELRRNCGRRGCLPKQAHHLVLNRQKKSTYRFLPGILTRIEAKICLDWIREQISGWLNKDHDVRVSHEWIYPHILADKRIGGDLHCHLRCRKKCRKRYGNLDRSGKLLNRRSIEESPEIVDQRQRLLDWEVDTILGKNLRQTIVTLTERKSRLVLIDKVEQRTAWSKLMN